MGSPPKQPRRASTGPVAGYTSLEIATLLNITMASRAVLKTQQWDCLTSTPPKLDRGGPPLPQVGGGFPPDPKIADHVAPLRPSSEPPKTPDKIIDGQLIGA